MLICPQAGACNVTQSFFRREALDAVNSIEALPHTLTVTGPLTRQCVCGLVLALAGGVVWSAYVSVPIQISGHGVLVDGPARWSRRSRPSPRGMSPRLSSRWAMSSLPDSRSYA